MFYMVPGRGRILRSAPLATSQPSPPAGLWMSLHVVLFAHATAPTASLSHWRESYFCNMNE